MTITFTIRVPNNFRPTPSNISREFLRAVRVINGPFRHKVLDGSSTFGDYTVEVKS
jgi:hypothetical protein